MSHAETRAVADRHAGTYRVLPRLAGMVDEVSRAYSRRVAEYIELLGSMTAVHHSDLQLISTWAGGVKAKSLTLVVARATGPISSPNTISMLAAWMQCPSSIAHARDTFSELIYFTLGTIESLDAVTDSVGGVLAWYSLIHHEPKVMGAPLLEICRALKPGEHVVVGFLESTALEEYAHAVTPAWRWPADLLSAELNAAGFGCRNPPFGRPMASSPFGSDHRPVPRNTLRDRLAYTVIGCLGRPSREPDRTSATRAPAPK